MSDPLTTIEPSEYESIMRDLDELFTVHPDGSQYMRLYRVEQYIRMLERRSAGKGEKV